MKILNKVMMLGALVVAATAIAMIPSDNASASVYPVPSWENSRLNVIRNTENYKGNSSTTITYTLTANDGNPGGVLPYGSCSNWGSYTLSIHDASSIVLLIFDNQYNNGCAFTFEKPGDYYYTLRETATTNGLGFPIDNQTSYTVIFSIRNDESDNSKYVGKILVRDSQGGKLDTTTGENTQLVFSGQEYQTKGSIKLITSTSGNSGYRDECFSYRITFSDTETAYVLRNSRSSSDPIIRACYPNDDDVPTSIKSGDTIMVDPGTDLVIGYGYSNYVSKWTDLIPIGTTYTIERVDDKTSYTTSIDGGLRTSITKTVVANNDGEFSSGNITTLDHNYDLDPATGVNMKVAIYAILAITGATGFYYLARKRFADKA